MPVRIVEAPAPVVSLVEAKAFLRVDHNDDDSVITGLVAAATLVLDGPDGRLGRALGPQVLELMTDCWGDRSLRLPCPPIIEPVSVVYVDVSGIEQTIDTAQYGLTGDLLWFRPSWTAPALACQPWPIKVRYRAGYDVTKTEAMPEPLLDAIKVHVKMQYDPMDEAQRESHHRTFLRLSERCEIPKL